MQLRKKRVSIIFFSCAIFAFGNLYAQSKEPIKLGLKISPNIGWMSPTTKDYSSGKVSAGVTVGFVSEFHFSERYAIVSGVNFAFLNANLKYADSLFTKTDSVSGQMYRKIKIIYLEVPLMIKMSTKQFGDFSFYGLAGFTAGFRLSAKANDEFVTLHDNFNEKKDFSGGTTLMRVSASIGIGSEYHLDTSTRIFLGLTYCNSLNNVLKGENNITKEKVKAWLNYLELNIGILF